MALNNLKNKEIIKEKTGQGHGSGRGKRQAEALRDKRQEKVPFILKEEHCLL